MENIAMRFTDAAPTFTRALLCATPATDLRTLDVRSDVRFGTAQGAAAQSVWAKRIRVTAPTTGMGLVGFAHIVLGATVPGSRTWSPPI